MVNFEDMILTLDRMRVLDILFPFILIFTIVFAILQKTKVLGVDEDKRPRKNFNIVVALVFGFAVVVPHVLGSYPANADIVTIINNALPNVSIVLVALLAVFLIIGLWGGEIKWLGGSAAGWVALASFLVIIYIFGAAANWWTTANLPFFLQWLDDPDTQAILLIILIFGIVIYFITREPSKKGEEGGFSKFLKEFGKIGGKGE